MKLCTYIAAGRTRTGIVVGDTVIDTGFDGTMIDLIRQWDALKPQLEASAQAGGDVVRCEIDRIGHIEATMVAE